MDIKVCKPQILNIPKTEHINCSCCSKKIKQNQRHISCSRCIHYIHKKCTLIKAKDFEKTNWTNWECPYCYNEKYPLPFANLDVDEISFLSFNSNLNCPCQYTQNKLPTNNLTMLLTSQTAKESIHIIDNIENDLEPKQNFKYYEVHDIHLLKDTIDINKQTSLLHTNICSPPSQWR